MQHRWRAEDKGLIWCWENGRLLAEQEPALAQRAKQGELMLLAWRGGVPAEFKGKKKTGTLEYLACWQGLAGKDLAIDTETPFTLTCSSTGAKVTFSKDA